MVGRAGSGNVVADNYIDMLFYEAGIIGNFFSDMSANGTHYAGTHGWLLEGNWANNCDGDETHGSSFMHVFYRNQCTGLRTTFVDPSNGLTVNDCNGTGFAPSTTNQSTGGQTISAGTYVSGTGVITLTTGAAHGLSSGVNVTIQALTGTGANLFNLSGTWVSQAGTTGSTIVLAGPAGQGTITLTGGHGFGNLPTTTGPQRPGGPMAFNYRYAFVANVMGQAGMQSCSGGAFVYGAGATQFNRSIWHTGWTGGEWGTNPDPNLNGVNGTPFIFRNGNFDYVNSAIVDNASGFAHTFPNSLYYASAPAYFGPGAFCTYTWPWIDSTSGTPVKSNSCSGPGLPAKARADAGTPFQQPLRLGHAISENNRCRRRRRRASSRHSLGRLHGRSVQRNAEYCRHGHLRRSGASNWPGSPVLREMRPQRSNLRG